MASSKHEDSGKGDVKQRAVDNIMKLINSQIALEKKQSKMNPDDKESGKASTRMADLEDTIEKLVAVAKRKGYIDQDATVESLKADAIKNREKDHHEDAVSLMAAMKKNLDAQTSAVTEFMKDRVNHDAEWEENAWAKLLNSNQDILVLMSRLQDRGLVTQDMINMATLPDKPPPPREQDMRGMSQSFDQTGGYAASTVAESSVMPNQGYNGSMMGQHQGMHGSMMNGMAPNMMPNGMMQNGMMPNGMMPGMMPQGSWGMPGSMQGSMMGMPGMMPNGMMPNGMMQNGSGMPMNPNGSFMSKGSKPATEHPASSSSDNDSDDSESDLHERLRELKGLAKEREKGKKVSRAEQTERNLFNKNKGIGHFNNAFKVAEDIRQLGAVPEEEEAKDPGLDKQMAKAMEERLLRNIEEDILRGKKDVIRSFMRGDEGAGGGGGGGATGMGSAMGSQMSGANSNAAQSVMQMQMMQQQNMMALQQMLMSMNMNPQTGSYYSPSGMGGPSVGAPSMGGPSMMQNGMQGGPSAMNGSMMGGGMSHPSMMGQPGAMNPQMMGMHPHMMGSQMGGMGSQMGHMQGAGSQMGQGMMPGAAAAAGTPNGNSGGVATSSAVGDSCQYTS